MRAPVTAVLLLLAACTRSDNAATIVQAPPASPATGSALADCANFAPDAFVTRTDLVPGRRQPGAQLLLRFVQFSDDHIIDDEGQALNGAAFLDPLYISFEAAQRLQDEYSDEALNDMIAGVNTCHAQYPAEFMIVTGDSADLTTVAETYDQMSAFESACAQGVPAPLVAAQCTRFTGRGVPDSQSVDPDPDDPAYQFLYTRTALQIANATAAAASGRAADGSVDPARETQTRSPGLPQVLRCHAEEPGCGNAALAMPWMVAFGNHDGYVRGTVALGSGINEISQATGRRYMLQQHEFIDEFFFTRGLPGPVGHGFGFADAARLADGDGRNDGYYAFDAGAGRLRMIVLNTIIDGADPRLPTELLRNPFALSDGTLDAAQFAWLQAELAQAWQRRQLVMMFSHHADLTFAEYGVFADAVPIDITAADLNAELAGYPNVIAWVAGHTHLHRVRAFKVENGQGSNGVVSAAVECKAAPCTGFWQIETASLIDYPQEQRLFEVLDNGDGTGVIRAPVLTHTFEPAKRLADADDRCMLYLSDPQAVAAAISEAGLGALCAQGGTRQGQPGDRNVELVFRMPSF
jgi:3',5'-cyclic AMP phosphodiesterase CpdA